MPVEIKRTHFSDFEIMRHASQDQPCEVMQIGTGRMSGDIAHLNFNGLGLTTGHFTRGLRMTGLISTRRWCLSSLLASQGPAIGYRSHFDVGDVIMAAPGEETYARLTDSIRYVTLLVEPQYLESFLAPHPGALEAMVQKRVAVLPVDQATAQAHLAQYQPAIDYLTRYGPTLPDRTVEFYMRIILSALTMPIRDLLPYRNETLQSQVTLVREAEHLAATNDMSHITELCETLRCSERTLFRAFHDVLGVSPISFLRITRLGEVHTELLQAGPDAMVRDIAMRHGFLQLGKFARDYYRQFGEKPSHTRMRARRRLLAMIFWFVAGLPPPPVGTCGMIDLMLRTLT